MTKEDFFDRLYKTLENIKRIYELDGNRDSVHDSFILWFGENYLSLDPDEIKPRIVEDSSAEGVDALLIDNIDKRLIFVAARTVKTFDKTTDNFPENDVKSTLAGIRFLVEGDYKGKITPELENLLNEYHALDKTGDYKTSVIFLAFKKPPKDNKYIEDFEKGFPTIKCEFFDFDKIYDFYKDVYMERTTSPPKMISFEVLTDVLKKETPHKSMVFTVKAKEIARIYNDYKERIFQQNVRFSLGIKNRTVNNEILNTAVDEKRSDDFWYFNNGITIVCDEIHVPHRGRIVNVKAAQIINGAQTTYALYDAYQNGRLKDNAEVLIKVIESSDKVFTENVTMYTNSQNAILLMDLLSNMPVQGMIQKVLLDAYGYFYEKKRGEFDSLYPTIDSKKKLLGGNYKTKLISNVNAAQAFLALYLNMPAEAKSGKRKIFIRVKDGGFFDDIFNEGDTCLAEKILLAWKLLKYIEMRIEEYDKERKKFFLSLISKKEEELTEDEKIKIREKVAEIYRFDYLLHGEHFILSIFRDFIKNLNFDIAKNRSHVIEVISMIDKNDEKLLNAYGDIKNSFAGYIEMLKTKEPDYYHNKLFKNKNSIALVRKHFSESYNFVEILPT